MGDPSNEFARILMTCVSPHTVGLCMILSKKSMKYSSIPLKVLYLFVIVTSQERMCIRSKVIVSQDYFDY